MERESNHTRAPESDVRLFAFAFIVGGPPGNRILPVFLAKDDCTPVRSPKNVGAAMRLRRAL